jgi:hypothetical protein
MPEQTSTPIATSAVLPKSFALLLLLLGPLTIDKVLRAMCESALLLIVAIPHERKCFAKFCFQLVGPRV